MLQKYTIQDCLKGCKAGDRKAQELLYKITCSKMLGVCMRYAKDQFEAEDMMQTGYIKIFEKINTFKEEGSFEGWMRRIMVNCSIEVYRKNTRMLSVVNVETLGEKEPGETDISGLQLQDLLKLINQLSPGYKLVFNLYVIEGYSHQEIANQLGISEGASKSQLSRARAILKEKIIKMEGYGYETNVG